MRPFRQHRAGFALAAAAAMATTTVSAPLAALAAENHTKVSLAQATKRSVLVFPFDVPATVGNRDEVRGLLTEMALSRLQASGSYSATQFHRSLPTVARLVIDQKLSDADVSDPFAEDNTKGTKIGKEASYEAIFLGSMDDYQWDDASKQVKIVVSGRLVEMETGKLIGTPVTLQGQSGTGGTAKEEERAVEAARNAGEQLMQKLVPIANTVTPQPVKPVKPIGAGPKKKRSNDWLWGVLAIGLGLGLGLSTGGGGGGGGASDGPPPPPR